MRGVISFVDRICLYPSVFRQKSVIASSRNFLAHDHSGETSAAQLR